jgi:hypothetical protein
MVLLAGRRPRHRVGVRSPPGEVAHLLGVEPVLGPLDPDRQIQGAVLRQPGWIHDADRGQDAFGQRGVGGERGDLVALAFRGQHHTDTPTRTSIPRSRMRSIISARPSVRQASFPIFHKHIPAARAANQTRTPEPERHDQPPVQLPRR